MVFSFTRRRHYAERPAEASKETPSGFVKSLLILAFLASDIAQPDRRAVQHPFGLDAADDDDRRLSVRVEMALRLFERQLPVRIPAVQGARSSARRPNAAISSCSKGPSGADVVKRVIGLPGDTVAVEGGQLILDGKPDPREQVDDYRHAHLAQQPMPRRAAGRGDDPAPRPTGSQGCVYPAYRETLPGGRSYVVLDQTDQSIADNFGPVTGARRAACS